jgi:hypothetical protein
MEKKLCLHKMEWAQRKMFDFHANKNRNENNATIDKWIKIYPILHNRRAYRWCIYGDCMENL